MNSKGITGTAAQYAVAYRGPNNLTDWFLPSLSELSLYYWSSVTEQKPTSGYYWSSSQNNSDYAWIFFFNYGYRASTAKNGNASSNDVRPVRAF